MIQPNNIYCMDCLKGLKMMKPNSVDLVITDPPYCDGVGYGRYNKQIENNENPALVLQVIFELQRVLRTDKSAYIFTNWKLYPLILDFVIRYTEFNVRNLLILNKNNFTMGYGFRNKYEMVVVLEKGKPLYFLNNFANVLDFKIPQQTPDTHPHMKPLDILIEMIKHSSIENDLVLDCFAGSGSTLLASKLTGRRYIGFEIDKKWYNVAKERLEQASLNKFGGVNDE